MGWLLFMANQLPSMNNRSPSLRGSTHIAPVSQEYRPINIIRHDGAASLFNGADSANKNDVTGEITSSGF